MDYTKTLFRKGIMGRGEKMSRYIDYIHMGILLIIATFVFAFYLTGIIDMIKYKKLFYWKTKQSDEAKK